MDGEGGMAGGGGRWVRRGHIGRRKEMGGAATTIRVRANRELRRGGDARRWNGS